MRRNHTGHRVGEGHHRAKLSDADVGRMRAMYRPYVFGMVRLARFFCVPVSTVRDIVTYATRPL